MGETERRGDVRRRKEIEGKRKMEKKGEVPGNEKKGKREPGERSGGGRVKLVERKKDWREICCVWTVVMISCSFAIQKEISI